MGLGGWVEEPRLSQKGPAAGREGRRRRGGRPGKPAEAGHRRRGATCQRERSPPRWPVHRAQLRRGEGREAGNGGSAPSGGGPEPAGAEPGSLAPKGNRAADRPPPTTGGEPSTLASELGEDGRGDSRLSRTGPAVGRESRERQGGKLGKPAEPRLSRMGPAAGRESRERRREKLGKPAKPRLSRMGPVAGRESRERRRWGGWGTSQRRLDTDAGGRHARGRGALLTTPRTMRGRGGGRP